MRRTTLRALLLAAAALMAAPAAPASPPVLTAAAQQGLNRDWQLFKSRFVTGEGRVVDDLNGSVSHTEGQGYALLVAVAADDRDGFELMLRWTDEHLFVREDELAAWRWDPAAEPPVQDMNNASDGDLLIAWALVRAAERWDKPEFRERAKAILEALAAETVIDSRFGKVMLPGGMGFDAESRPNGPVVNLSYWIFPALAELDGLEPTFPAAEIAATGLKILEATARQPPGIASDWTSLAGEEPRPADGFPLESGYNALRIPLYLVWGGYDGDLLQPWLQAWRRNGAPAPAVIALPSGQRTVMDDPDYAALGTLLACATATTVRPASLAAHHYYPSILHLLSHLTLAERYPQCA